LPWNIYGDQRDSLALLDHGWIQAYAASNQEALDMALMAYSIAEDARVSLPFMVNLDGFALTHTYEAVDVPDEKLADEYLPPYATSNRFDFVEPKNIGYSAGPEFNRYYQAAHHEAMIASRDVIYEAESRFAQKFGREYSGLIETHNMEGAQAVIVTLGSTWGLVREVSDKLRAEGLPVGALRIRYMRPFPFEELAEAFANVTAIGVLERDISFGAEGTVFTNVQSALARAGRAVFARNYIGGLGGDDITAVQIEQAYRELLDGAQNSVESSPVYFLGIEELEGE
jgi:pyruvate ferredoxin oxidoreductase alpha subunit